MSTLTAQETSAILKLCLMAAFTDGDKCGIESDQVRKISDSLDMSEVDLPSLYREIIMSPPDVNEIAKALTTSGSRRLAYEMAVCVCESDNVLQEAEKAFLQKLRAALDLPAATSDALISDAATLAIVPPPADAPKSDTEAGGMIMRYAVVAGALELLPQTMATLAIVPLQTKMVYRIGKQHGFNLDRKSVGEFMAAIGLGLASQVFEGFARRLTKGLGKKIAGKIGGKIGDTAAGVAMSFATTYALGHLAVHYYSSGRSLSVEAMKASYAPLLEKGKTLALENQQQILAQCEKLRGGDLASLMKNVP
jgi:uncharacterized protein (DUF697 family)